MVWWGSSLLCPGDRGQIPHSGSAARHWGLRPGLWFLAQKGHQTVCLSCPFSGSGAMLSRSFYSGHPGSRKQSRATLPKGPENHLARLPPFPFGGWGTSTDRSQVCPHYTARWGQKLKPLASHAGCTCATPPFLLGRDSCACAFHVAVLEFNCLVWVSALPLPGSATSGKMLNFFVPSFFTREREK